MSATVKEYLRELAWRYFQAMLWPNQSGSDLPEATRLVLLQSVGNTNRAWGLALILAAWRMSSGASKGAELVRQYLANTGTMALVAQISGLKAAFPDGFQKFLDTAQESGEDSKLASAASYFASTAAGLSSFTRPALHAWLGGDAFTAAELQMITLIGEPPIVYQTAKAQNRSGFDKADYAARPAQVGPQSREQPAPARPVTTKVDRESFASAFLLSLGWTQSDIARILVGPGQSHATAEGLFRQAAAQSPEARSALVGAFDRAGSDRVQIDPLLVDGLNPDHLTPDSGPLSVEQLVSQFASLPAVQQKRFLLLLPDLLPAPASPSGTRPTGPDGSRPNGSPSGTRPTGKPSGTMPTSGAGGSKPTVDGGAKGDKTTSDVVGVVKGTVDTLTDVLKKFLDPPAAKKPPTSKGKSPVGSGKGGNKTDSDKDKGDAKDSSDPAKDEPDSKDTSDDSDSKDTSDSDSDQGDTTQSSESGDESSNTTDDSDSDSDSGDVFATDDDQGSTGETGGTTPTNSGTDGSYSDESGID